MRYQEFVDSILEGLREYYQDDAVISVNTVLCNNNGYRDALHIRYTKGDSKICPSIYLDTLYQEFEEGSHDIGYYIDTVIQMRKDYINRTLKVERQLGRVHNAAKEDFAPKTFTKQEIGLKTESSYRELPIPDIVFEAILEERQKYEKNRSRRGKDYQDMNYICCSSYGRPRSKGYHWKYYKQLLTENGLPDIRWHDLRSTYCTLLLKESFNPKAVSKLMGHAKEIITMDTYGDNRNIIADGVPEIEAYMKEVLPDPEAEKRFKEELLEIVPDVSQFLPDIA